MATCQKIDTRFLVNEAAHRHRSYSLRCEEGPGQGAESTCFLVGQIFMEYLLCASECSELNRYHPSLPSWNSRSSGEGTGRLTGERARLPEEGDKRSHH